MVSLTTRIDALEHNLAINGNIDIAQRFTSSANIGANVVPYTVDRFRNEYGGLGFTATIDQVADVPTLAQSGFQSVNSLRFTQNASTNTRGILWEYCVEGYDYQRLHGGKKFRLQFWVKASIAGVYGVVLSNNTEDRYYATTYTVASANTWQKVVLDMPTDTAGVWQLGSGLGLRIWIGINNGSGEFTPVAATTSWQAGAGRLVAGTVSTVNSTNGATFQIAQFQIIPQDFTAFGTSSIDVPFSRGGRTFQQEIAACQRYYEKSFDLGFVPANGPNNSSFATNVGVQVSVLTGFVSGTPDMMGSVPFRVSKRSNTSSITIYGDNTGRQIYDTGTVTWLNVLQVRGTSENSFAINQVTDPSYKTVVYHWTADADF